MTTEHNREWREALGAYALGHLSEQERVSLEAHLEGCPACRAEATALASVANLLPHADPERFGPAPVPPPELGKRITATIDAERRSKRRQRSWRSSSSPAAMTAVPSSTSPSARSPRG